MILFLILHNAKWVSKKKTGLSRLYHLHTGIKLHAFCVAAIVGVHCVVGHGLLPVARQILRLSLFPLLESRAVGGRHLLRRRLHRQNPATSPSQNCRTNQQAGT